MTHPEVPQEQEETNRMSKKRKLKAENEQLREALEAVYNAYFGRETTPARVRAMRLARKVLGGPQY